ncbi:MAG: hypothetical protein V1723_00925 [Candidatus Uhrbacteria bacterium]
MNASTRIFAASIIAAVSLFLVTASASAEKATPAEEPATPGLPPAALAANVGALEVLALNPLGHVGVYPYVGASMAVPVADGLTVIPSVSIEYSPELGNWGLVGVVTADYALNGTIGVDVLAAFVHDQHGAAFNEAAFFTGPGIGTTVFIGRWTVSPSISAFYGLNGAAAGTWSAAPALNVGYAF